MRYAQSLSLLTIGLLLATFSLSGCDSVGGDDSADSDSPPAAPSGLSVSPQDGAVNLTWSAVEEADTYNVYRSTSRTDGGAGDPLESEISGGQTEYTDDTAKNGRIYYYRVTAVEDDNESEGSDEVRAEMPPAEPDNAWAEVESGIDNTVHDVAYTTEGAYAVAGGGILLKRRDTGWEKVITDGPNSNGNDLFGLDVTADSTRLWLVGASGAVGEYDVTTDSLNDRSAPNDVTNNFRGVAVTGESGSARVTIVDASGKVHYSSSNGESGTWETVTPGSGAELLAVDFYAGTEGHLVDGNQKVFPTSDGETWGDAIGIEDADVGLSGLDSDASDDVWVVGGNGTVYQWDGAEWTPTDVGDTDLTDVEVADDDQSGYVVGKSGAVSAFDGNGWIRQKTPTAQNLEAIVQGNPDIAVGASGTILER